MDEIDSVERIHARFPSFFIQKALSFPKIYDIFVAMKTALHFIQKLRLWLRKYPLMRKFLKFGIVGTISTLVSLAAFWLMNLQFPQYNLLSKAIGYILGFFVGFGLNKFWTYIDQTDDDEKYLVKYIMVYGITFVIYLVFNFVCDHYAYPNLWMAHIVEPMGYMRAAAWMEHNGPLISNMLSIVLNVFLNFFGTNFLVFRVPDPDRLFEEN